MKLKIKDLIPNQFYCLKTNYDNINKKYYIKYTCHNNSHVYCDGYYCDEGRDRIRYYEHPLVFCETHLFDELYIIYKINISLIIDYLPSNNPDKINYYRRKKINSLLNETQIR